MSSIPASVSVIIPTLNAEKSIGALLGMLQSQSVNLQSIIIIDSASDDATAAIAKSQGAKVLAISRSQFNHGSTRNLAASEAQGEIIVFMTQDSLPVNVYTIERLISPLCQGKAAAAYGRQLPYDNADMIERFWRKHNYPDVSEIKSRDTCHRRLYFFSDVCSAFVKPVFDKLGGFDPAETNEDMLMAYKLLTAGYMIAYQSDAEVYHSHNYSLWQKCRRYYLIGKFMQRCAFLKTKTSNEKEGWHAALHLLKYLYGNSKYYLLPAAVADMAIRYCAYLAGSLVVRLISR